VQPPGPVHDFRFQFRFQGLDLVEYGEAGGRAIHLALQLAEDFVQARGGTPEGRIVLAKAGVHEHVGSQDVLDIMIVFEDLEGQ
jgi:hypothetical protein